MREHVESVHQGLKYQCHLCSSTTRRERDLKRHIRNTHGPHQANTDDRNSKFYQCSLCDYKTDTYPQLLSHLENNHENIKTEQTEYESLIAVPQLLSHLENNHENIKTEQTEYESLIAGEMC